MHKLKDIKEKMIEKIEETYKDHPTLEPAVLSYIDTLAHAAKNIAKICDSDDEGEYASRGRSMRGYPMVFDGHAYDGEAYAGRRYAKRDSMGRYSRDDGYSREGGYSRDGGYSRGHGMADEIEDLIERAPDEQTRKDLEKIADRMRG